MKLNTPFIGPGTSPVTIASNFLTISFNNALLNIGVTDFVEDIR